MVDLVMADGTPIPLERRTVEAVFKDFKSRRNAILNALTTEVGKFFRDCDPDKDELSLHGFPNGNWEVGPLAEDVPPVLPEPVLGINFFRDEMPLKDWLKFVATHSDTWLLSVAFYVGTCFKFEKEERKRLFNLINRLPTIFEIVNGGVEQPKETSTSRNSGSKRKSTTRKPKSSGSMMRRPLNTPSPSESTMQKPLNAPGPIEPMMQGPLITPGPSEPMMQRPLNTPGPSEPMMQRPINTPGPSEPMMQRPLNTSGPSDQHGGTDESGDKNEDGYGDQESKCGKCGSENGIDSFWICCDTCEIWFHGKCVNITPEMAQYIDKYKCPICWSKNRPRV